MGSRKYLRLLERCGRPLQGRQHIERLTYWEASAQ
jgi:hypothetical protein